MMWLNGELVENGTLDASSAGLMLGWGVFTTVGIRDGAPLFLNRHVARLERDAIAASLDSALDDSMVRNATRHLLQAKPLQNGLLRLTLTARGDGRWNTQNGTDFSIMAIESVPASGAARLYVAPYYIDARCPLVGVKTTSYLPYFQAWREARNAGFDEAILRDGQGSLCEGARSSLFWLRDDVLYTPSLETGCLRGLGRDLVLEWAAERIEVKEGCFQLGTWEGASEIWLVSAATGARAVASWHHQGEFSLPTPDSRWRAEFQTWWQVNGVLS